jgi:hypothetical protein
VREKKTWANAATRRDLDSKENKVKDREKPRWK